MTSKSNIPGPKPGQLVALTNTYVNNDNNRKMLPGP